MLVAHWLTLCDVMPGAIHCAVRSNAWGQVKQLLQLTEQDVEEAGMFSYKSRNSIFSCDFCQASPLWVAATLNRVEIMRTLVSHGADVNSSSDHGVTPLAAAVECNNTDVVRFLILRKAAINKACSLFNLTPLMVATIKDNAAMCRLLLDHGASVNAKDVLGRTALHLAARQTCLDALRVLLRHGADVNARDGESHSVLVTAVTRWQQSVSGSGMGRAVYTVHDPARKLTETDPLEHRLVKAATDKKRLQAVRMLVWHGACVTQSDHYGCTVITAACNTGDRVYLASVLAALGVTEEQETEAYELFAARCTLVKDDPVKTAKAWRRARDARAKMTLKPTSPTLSSSPSCKSHTVAKQPPSSSSTILPASPDPRSAAVMKMQAVGVRNRILGRCWRTYWDADNLAWQMLVSRDDLPTALEAAMFASCACYPGCSRLRPIRRLCQFLFRAHSDIISSARARVPSVANKRDVEMLANGLLKTLTLVLEQLAAGPDPFPQREPDVLEKADDFRQCGQVYRSLVVSLLWVVLHLPAACCDLDMLKGHLRNLLKAHTSTSFRRQRGEELRILHTALAENSYDVTLADDNRFPSWRVVCFAADFDKYSIDSLGDLGDRPLHACGLGFSKASSNTLHFSIERQERYSKMAAELLRRGAHWDSVGTDGIRAYKLLPASLCRPGHHVTLFCLAARIVKKCHIIRMASLPRHIVDFINLH